MSQRTPFRARLAIWTPRPFFRMVLHACCPSQASKESGSFLRRGQIVHWSTHMCTHTRRSLSSAPGDGPVTSVQKSGNGLAFTPSTLRCSPSSGTRRVPHNGALGESHRVDVKCGGRLLTPPVCFPAGFLGSLHQRAGPLPHPLLVPHESTGAR